MNQDDLNRALTISIDFLDDCERIARVALKRHGVILSTEGAHHIWTWHSESRAAGWLCIPEGDHGDDQIESAISSFVNCALT